MSTLDATAPVAAAPRSAAQFRRFARRNPTIVAGGSILIAIAVLALLAPLYAGDAITMHCADFAATRLPSASFDAVCMIESACHAEGTTKTLLLREAFSRFFTEYYLIPVGLIFIAMVIFMPQGLLGFMRRWLNR